MIAGSHLYGTATEFSDEDRRGVVYDPLCAMFGLESFEQIEEKEPYDKVLYGLRKFTRLALQNNPNILDTLFTPPEYWKIYTEDWLDLYAKRHWFLSQRIRKTYAGYAKSQIYRIKQHKRWLTQADNSKEYKEWLNNRNPARHALEIKYGYDTKHAAHLARLLVQARDILRDRTYNPTLTGANQTIVLEVLHGRVLYDDLLEWSGNLLAEIEHMHSDLPLEPDSSEIEAIIMGILYGYAEREYNQ